MTEVMPCYKARFDGVFAAFCGPHGPHHARAVTKLALMESLRQHETFACHESSNAIALDKREENP